MPIWAFCEDLDEPELGVCLSMDHWDEHEAEIRAWFRNEGKEIGSIFGERVVWVKQNKRSMFLLKFG
jgi:hypothetical protein